MSSLGARLLASVGTFGALELGVLAVPWVLLAFLAVALPAWLSYLATPAPWTGGRADLRKPLTLSGGWGTLLLMLATGVAGDMLMTGAIAAVVWAIVLAVHLLGSSNRAAR